MIKTIAELLKEFVTGEKLALNRYNIKHRPTIGSMYEGLTQELVNRSIFEGLNLNVTTQSFIDGCDTEFDVILSEEEGSPIPYTNSFKFKPSQVIAVIQVKKTLTCQELKNSYENLIKVTQVFQENINSMDASMVNDSFKKICHKEISAYNKGLLNKQEEYIYHTLVMDSFFPIRIVLGYNGYKTKTGLRDSFVDFLESNMSTENKLIKGFSPISFPNLIISDNYSLIKLTGCPYCSPFGNVKYGWWEIMTSSHYNPMYIFLEVLWTKLSYRFHNLPSVIFGYDLETEPLISFLRTKIHINNNNEPIGWDYEYSEIKEEELSQLNEAPQWHPIAVDSAQVQVLLELSQHDIDILNASELKKSALENGYSSLNELIKTLENESLVTLENSTLKLLANQLEMVISPDGKTYAANNYDDKFTQWILTKTSNNMK